MTASGVQLRRMSDELGEAGEELQRATDENVRRELELIGIPDLKDANQSAGCH